MRRQVAAMLIGAALCGCHHRAARSQLLPLDTRTTIDSGVWGFSGAGERFGEPKGVIGTCIWIYDESDRVEIADGDCTTRRQVNSTFLLSPVATSCMARAGISRFQSSPGNG